MKRTYFLATNLVRICKKFQARPLFHYDPRSTMIHVQVPRMVEQCCKGFPNSELTQIIQSLIRYSDRRELYFLSSWIPSIRGKFASRLDSLSERQQCILKQDQCVGELFVAPII